MTMDLNNDTNKKSTKDGYGSHSMETGSGTTQNKPKRVESTTAEMKSRWKGTLQKYTIKEILTKIVNFWENFQNKSVVSTR